jgi:hypothetical protein
VTSVETAITSMVEVTMSDAVAIVVVVIVTNPIGAAIPTLTKLVISEPAAPAIIVVSVFDQYITGSGATADKAANERPSLALEQPSNQSAGSSASCDDSNLLTVGQAPVSIAPLIGLVCACGANCDKNYNQAQDHPAELRP